ncbi:MAG: hypothetical protein V4805_06045, partial [Pseudomonadota bacterium]
THIKPGAVPCIRSSKCRQRRPAQGENLVQKEGLASYRIKNRNIRQTTYLTIGAASSLDATTFPVSNRHPSHFNSKPYLKKPVLHQPSTGSDGDFVEANCIGTRRITLLCARFFYVAQIYHAVYIYTLIDLDKPSHVR